MSMCCARVLSATPGISLASIAIRWSRVEMVSGLGVPVIFPSSGSLTRHSLPSTGSAGACSPASPVQRSAPTPDRPSRRASFPSRNGTVRALDVRSWGGRARHPRAWAVRPGAHPGSLARRRSGLPGSWGAPMCASPLFDPGELFTPGLLRRVDTAFRLPNDVGARGYYLSRLNHAACTLPVYASQRGSLRHHATLGSGWWPASAGRGWFPAGPRRKVSEITLTSLPPFPGFAWRTRSHQRGGTYTGADRYR